MNIAKTLALAGLVVGAAGFAIIDSARAGETTRSWSGAYIAANLGYGWDSGDATLLMKPAPARAPDGFPVEDIQGIIDAFQVSNVAVAIRARHGWRRSGWV